MRKIAIFLTRAAISCQLGWSASEESATLTSKGACLLFYSKLGLNGVSGLTSEQLKKYERITSFFEGYMDRRTASMPEPLRTQVLKNSIRFSW